MVVVELEGGSVLRWLSKAWVGLASLLLAVLSISLTVYLYTTSKKERKLTYYVHPVRALVVKSGSTSSLRVLHEDEEIKSDVTVAQIAIWNEGRESIRPQNILNEVIITTEPSVPILEAKVRKSTRDIVEFKIDNARLSQGVVAVSWKILEHNDGAVVQFVYAGSPETVITVDGIIEGQDEIVRYEFKGKIKSPSEQLRGLKRENLIGGGICLVLGVMMLLFSLWERRRTSKRPLPSKSSRKFTRYMSTAYIVFLLAAGTYLLVKATSSPGPPFGF